ncbi:MAG: glycosyl transferase [Desulfobacteraceae bacterium]|nr:MAG: glycosyl transferase [Desulfobacteraceae bacterium]
MSDFWQHGMITTLQMLGKRPVEEIEAELTSIGKSRKIDLLLPALFSEFETPAMPRIIDQLSNTRYLHRIVLSLDRASREEFEYARKRMSVLPSQVRVIWQDSPAVQNLYQELMQADFKLDFPGKGRSVWMAMGYILAEKDVYAIATHDSDILNYEREMLARLVYPVVHQATEFEFSKGYYSRVRGKFYGRVTRLFYTPLIRTLRRIIGFNLFLSYLDSFRYALSGEFSLVASLARGIRISPTWGLEVSLLSEVYQRASIDRVCQVEIAKEYEHKHQILEKGKPHDGLIRMAADIGKALFRVLAQGGIVMSSAFFRTLQTAYIQEARITIEKYHALALLNGLSYDRHSEIEAVEAFLGALKSAIAEFVKDPVGIPMLPAWVRIAAAIPDFQDRLSACIEEMNAG